MNKMHTALIVLCPLTVLFFNFSDFANSVVMLMILYWVGALIIAACLILAPLSLGVLLSKADYLNNALRRAWERTDHKRVTMEDRMEDFRWPADNLFTIITKISLLIIVLLLPIYYLSTAIQFHYVIFHNEPAPVFSTGYIINFILVNIYIVLVMAKCWALDTFNPSKDDLTK